MERGQAGVAPRIDHVEARLPDEIEVTPTFLRRVMQRTQPIVIQCKNIGAGSEQLFRRFPVCYEQRRPAPLIRRLQPRRCRRICVVRSA